MLFDGEYLPTTNTVCFIMKSFSDIVDYHYAKEQSIGYGPNIMIERMEMKVPPRKLVGSLFPLSNEVRRHIFLPARSGYTAYMNNSLDGTDPVDLYGIVRNLRCPGFRIVSQPHTYKKNKGTGEYGAAILESYWPDKSKERMIYSVHDGYRWEFDESGPPFPFEDLSLYKKRLKRERFNPEILKSYTDKLGIFFQDEDFYCPPGSPDPVMICKRGPRWPNYRDKTLEEYQNER